MKTMKHLAATALLAMVAFTSRAGEVVEVPLPRGQDVSLPYFAQWREGAVATLVMFSGGEGGYGRVAKAGEWPRSNNFVIRTAPQFAERPFNLVLVGRASDVPAIEYAERASERHLQDNLALLRDVKRRQPGPIWLVGTSRGTVSAAALAIGDKEKLVDGLVLTSSVTEGRYTGAVPGQKLSAITVPTLVVHHRNDACRATPPHGVPWIVRGLANAPVKASVIVEGGEDQATGDPCAALHNHGFRGIEAQVVEVISRFVVKPEGK